MDDAERRVVEYLLRQSQQLDEECEVGDDCLYCAFRRRSIAIMLNIIEEDDYREAA